MERMHEAPTRGGSALDLFAFFKFEIGERSVRAKIDGRGLAAFRA